MAKPLGAQNPFESRKKENKIQLDATLGQKSTVNPFANTSANTKEVPPVIVNTTVSQPKLINQSEKNIKSKETLLEKFKQLSNRDTNFIFLFGKPASGKSYITASMIYYMQTCGLGTLHITKSNSREAELLVEDMYKNFHDGVIISRTNRIDPPYEIDLVFEPKDKRLPEMKITFLEISGENLQKVKVSDGDSTTGTLPDDIQIYLKCRDIKLIFFLVADHQTASHDSTTINKFLEYVHNKNENLDNSSYLLAITKWDTYCDRNNEDVDAFARRNMPNIYSRLMKNNKFCKKNAITHYSIGEFERVDGNDATAYQILTIDKSRANAVTKWLYKAITNKSLVPEPSYWDIFKEFLGI